MRLALAVLAMLALPVLLSTYWPFAVSFDELVLLIAAVVTKAMWHATGILAQVLLGTLVIFALIILREQLRLAGLVIGFFLMYGLIHLGDWLRSWPLPN
ncbi:MAG: hypothetical protein K0S35_2302 [Geminicoccaceae bacterium]|jgi:hypothetical protein|nr:hypothetical protein [Geminicoccaceae bacterium]